MGLCSTLFLLSIIAYAERFVKCLIGLFVRTELREKAAVRFHIPTKNAAQFPCAAHIISIAEKPRSRKSQIDVGAEYALGGDVHKSVAGLQAVAGDRRAPGV